MKFMTAFRKEWLELIRTKRMLIALVVLVLFGMTSPLLAKMLPEIMTMVPGGEQFTMLIPPPTINDAVVQYVKNITQFGILLALLFGMGSMANERDKGTAAMVLSKPMPRITFLLAKLIAYTTLFTLAIAIAGIACYYYTYILFGKLDIIALPGNEWTDPALPAGVCCFDRVVFNTDQNPIHRNRHGIWRTHPVWNRQRHPGVGSIHPDLLVANARIDRNRRCA